MIRPGGPYWKWPWEKVHKVSIATQTLNMAYDPENPSANSGGTFLEEVTKDQLNTGLTGRFATACPTAICESTKANAGCMSCLAR